MMHLCVPATWVNTCLGWDGALPSEPIPPINSPLYDSRFSAELHSLRCSRPTRAASPSAPRSIPDPGNIEALVGWSLRSVPSLSPLSRSHRMADLAFFLRSLDHAPPVEEETGAVRNWSTTCASSRALVPSPRCPSWKM